MHAYHQHYTSLYTLSSLSFLSHSHIQRLNENLKSAREKQKKSFSDASKTSQSLKDAHKQLEAQELVSLYWLVRADASSCAQSPQPMLVLDCSSQNLALRKRNVSMLEEQLADAQAMREESQATQAEWKEEK